MYENSVQYNPQPNDINTTFTSIGKWQYLTCSKDHERVEEHHDGVSRLAELSLVLTKHIDGHVQLLADVEADVEVEAVQVGDVGEVFHVHLGEWFGYQCSRGSGVVIKYLQHYREI